jgi:hypothetical protein
MSPPRHWGAGRSKVPFTTWERDAKYRAAYEIDVESRERLRAGIEEFREMLEAISRREVRT